ncbi:MAG: DUF3570 domain-containing protein [Flavisolibacter sp.]
MRRLSLTVIGMYLGILGAFSQSTDSSAYKSRKLHTDEVDFVSGYYRQDGNNSAVTGGVGSEKLTDFANTIEIKLSKYDQKFRKHNFSFELGVDHYTSASSDKIDPYTISSASSKDTRIYPSFSWSIQNEEKKTTFGLNTSFSKEFDYTSFGIGTSFTKASRDNNLEFTGKLQAYLDQWSVILPIELRPNQVFGFREHHYPKEARNSFSGSLSLAKVVNKNFQLLLIAEPTYQQGLLATKYQRVYFRDGSEQAETLPDNRFKIPLGIRANYFFGDRIILRSFYRYYQDNWGLKAHTLDLEAPVKVTPFLSISPFYRYYTQNAVDYFAPYAQHAPGETYFSSDYDLSKFNSHFFGAGFRVAPPEGVLGMKHLNSVEIRYGHYNRSNGLHSDQVSLHLKFK